MKQKIIERLIQITEERIANAKVAMDAAQESANGEGKSSAGDKYETSRAMGQIDRDMYARQMANALNEKSILDKIDGTVKPISVGLGSLVTTSNGIFMIAVSLGKIEIDKLIIMAVSSNSPIGSILLGKKVGDTFLFLGKQNKVISLE
jgi:transcription elongation GreA/GreB family factor